MQNIKERTRSKSIQIHFGHVTNLEVIVNEGSEGLRHDPYGYSEYSFTWLQKRHGHSHDVDIHLGLLENIKVDREEKARGYENVKEVFKQITGRELEEFCSLIHNYQPICKCGSTEGKYMNGYPGEHFLVCEKCGEVIDSYFKESEIM